MRYTNKLHPKATSKEGVLTTCTTHSREPNSVYAPIPNPLYGAVLPTPDAQLMTKVDTEIKDKTYFRRSSHLLPSLAEMRVLWGEGVVIVDTSYWRDRVPG